MVGYKLQNTIMKVNTSGVFYGMVCQFGALMAQIRPLSNEGLDFTEIIYYLIHVFSKILLHQFRNAFKICFPQFRPD